jgi:GNAT superfamily N-acetyltransferase
MEEPSQEMADLAFDVFDKYGYLKLKYKDHCVQKGIGVWGEELDYGGLLLIEHIEITERDWRRKGLGRVMVNLLVDKAKQKSKPKPMSPAEAELSQLLHGTEEFEEYASVHTIVKPGFLVCNLRLVYS